MPLANVDIRTPDGICDAYFVVPETGGPYPGVILYMDAFGLRTYLEDMARKLSDRGYAVLVPNLFYRARRAPVLQGVKFPLAPEARPAAIGQLMPLIQQFTPEMSVRDSGAFIEFLAKQKQVRPGKLGATGYCMGAAQGLRAAAAYPDRFGAVACFHGGRLATDAPESPHLLLPKIRAELYFGHAENDTSMPAEQIERLDRALAASGLKYETELYGAEHGFTMMDLPAGNAAALEKHWQQLFALFKSLGS